MEENKSYYLLVQSIAYICISELHETLSSIFQLMDFLIGHFTYLYREMLYTKIYFVLVMFSMFTDGRINGQMENIHSFRISVYFNESK